VGTNFIHPGKEGKRTSRASIANFSPKLFLNKELYKNRKFRKNFWPYPGEYRPSLEAVPKIRFTLSERFQPGTRGYQKTPVFVGL
jgi:hypothetical protein